MNEKMNQQEWIISCNLTKYDIFGALSELKIVDWRQTQQIINAQVGDIVYLYISGVEEGYIEFKGFILKVKKEEQTIDDSKFSKLDDWKGHYMEVAFFRKYDNTEGLKRSNLEEAGLTSTLQSPIRVKGRLAEHLHMCDREQKRIDDKNDSVKEECLNDFPIEIKEEIEPKIYIDDYKYSFCTFIHEKDKNNNKIDFNDESSYLYPTEHYKKELFEEVQEILSIENWDESWIGSGKISNKISEIVEKSGNLLYWKHNNKEQLIEKLPKLEKTLYHLYKEDLNEAIFKELMNVLGGNYRNIAFLLFIKDDKKYFPTTPETFDRIFEMLNLDFRMSHKCSYDNYLEYCDIILKVYSELKSDPSFKEGLEPIDAHSFLWIIGGEKYDNWKKGLSTDQETIKQKVVEIEKEELKGEDKEVVIKRRVNQGVFRSRLLKRYSRCCLCNISNPSFLTAGHLKPWSKSNEEERLDVNNGFLFCPNHDVLFDNGYITFTDEGHIMISDLVSDTDRLFMNINEEMKIDVAEENKEYLKYHREHEFEKMKK